ncbi:unnamed protein product [Diatraea saccharalis]|uniref:Chitin-binding type-2 domain-containing protein n=1 Tax=Diatraea saccharalis TaxID=40085 RepID=A0A9N9WB18_9NEOP|nr:unnamed protein product [Diatraea saccharalis]
MLLFWLSMDLSGWLKSKHVQGLELHDAHKALNKTRVSEMVDAARSALKASGGGPLFLALPSHPELLAKYYDLRTLMKKVDLMMVQTHALGVDSVVDLVVGLGVPASKVVISLSATAQKFTLMNETLSTPGSPTAESDPKEIDQSELCRLLQKGRWTLERDQDLSAPYAFRSLEHEILSALGHARALDALQVSPYRITQVVDSDGVIHSIREDTRTEFTCSRQGYFVHPRSCARFYRCVKFDQLSPEYTVFEFDCPGGLAFDSRYEVCVWPGSLPHSQACPGSSEIAPVPHTRFICPEHEGYYADPENCRWFFACLDHGKSPLTAYEFRCPFGLGFDAARLKCDWPWLVPACGNIARYEAEAHGFSSAILTG